MLLLQIFAMVASYLVFSVTFVGALQVNIITDSEEIRVNIQDFSDFIEKRISYPYDRNVQFIKIEISPVNPVNEIKKVYLYKCKGYNPAACVGNTVPDIGAGEGASIPSYEQTFKWSDVQSGGVANFLIVVKIEIMGKTIWTGSWDEVVQTGVKTFEHNSYEISNLNIYPKSGVSAEGIKSYIESYNRIPTASINHSVLANVDGSAVSKLYELSGDENEIDPAGTENPNFYTNTLSGNSFNESLKTYSFVLGGDGKIANPIVFYTEEEEISEVGARLVIDNWNPQIVTCGSEDVINITSHVENASEINCGSPNCYFQSYYYEIDGVQSSPGSITCSIIDPTQDIYSYECLIYVNKLPSCEAPGTSTLTLYFVYQGETKIFGSFPITLQKAPPELIINSISPNPFDCGLDTVLSSVLRINNPPGGNPSISYTFDGVNFHSLSCSFSGNLYSCSIPENEICPLLQENLQVTFKFVYDGTEILSSPAEIFVTFPPPSMGIDTVTPQMFTAGEIAQSEVLLHVNYPDSITYELNDFKYKYLDRDFEGVTCSASQSFANIKYYECDITLDIPSNAITGPNTLTFRLDGFQDGNPKSLTANSFIEIMSPPLEPSLTITSTSSPLDCITDSSLTIHAKVGNIEGEPTYQYSIDGGKTFETLTCSKSGNVFECSITREDICPLNKNSLTLILKFKYPDKELISNPQEVYIRIPEPHIEVFYFFPTNLTRGETTEATIGLYIQYPEYITESPSFFYEYEDKGKQRMTCSKTKSDVNRDYYECSASFSIPKDFARNYIYPVFSIEGTTLTFVMTVSISEPPARMEPYIDIYSTEPANIEIEQGNTTEATLHFTLVYGLENDIKQISFIPSGWVTKGECEETEISYDYKCDITISSPSNAELGDHTLSLKLRASNEKTYDLSREFKVRVVAKKKRLEIQSLTPEALYCPGSRQTNPSNVRVVLRVVNAEPDHLLDEEIRFNNRLLEHTGRYCSLQGASITCNVPTDKLLNLLTCGEEGEELAPGEGILQYELSLEFELRKGGEAPFRLSSSKDIGVHAPPLQAKLKIAEESISQTTINCLSSTTIKIDSVGIIYADLLHTDPDPDDLTWSFKLDAQDNKGKLTRGLSLGRNETICKLKTYQAVDTHRDEYYECSLYVTTEYFQRCDHGFGTIELIATSKSTGKSAKGGFDIVVMKGMGEFDIRIDVEKPPLSKTDCQIHNYEGDCQIYPSRLNTTIKIKNLGTGPIDDLKLYDSDITLEGGEVEVETSSHCREITPEQKRYTCSITVGPKIRLPGTGEYKIREDDTKQTFPELNLGSLKLTVYYRYANNLAQESKSTTLGSLEVTPRKTDALINIERTRRDIEGVLNTLDKITKGALFLAGFCITCHAGVSLWNKIDDTIDDAINKANKEKANFQAERDSLKKELNELRKEKQSLERDTAIKDLEERIAALEEKIKQREDDQKDLENKKEEEQKRAEELSTEEQELLKLKEELNNLKAKPDKTGEEKDRIEELRKEIEIKEQQLKFVKGNFTYWSDQLKINKKLAEKGDLGTAIGIAAGMVIVLMVGYQLLSKPFSAEDQENQYWNAVWSGIKWGFLCVALKFFSMVFTDWIGEKPKTLEDAKKQKPWSWYSLGVGLGEGADWLKEACMYLGKMTPLLFEFIKIYTNWLNMQMCLKSVRTSVGYGDTTLSTMYGTQSITNQITNCLGMLDKIEESIYRAGGAIGGTWDRVVEPPNMHLVLRGVKIPEGRTRELSSKEELDMVKVRWVNLCKAYNRYENINEIKIYHQLNEENEKLCGIQKLFGTSVCSDYDYFSRGWRDSYYNYRPPDTNEIGTKLEVDTLCYGKGLNQPGEHKIYVYNPIYSATLKWI
jgi:hypothetical protein